MINIDVEIAILTKEYIEKLENCEDKLAFEQIVEEFDSIKAKLIEDNNVKMFDEGSSRWRSTWGWYGGLSASYNWLVSNYVYLHPDCSLDIFPDVLRYKHGDAMFAIAVTHKGAYEWFRPSMIEENGVKNYTGNSLSVKRFFSRCNIDRDFKLFKKYLGNNVFLISKAYKPSNGFAYKEILYKLCFSFDEFVEELEGDLSGAEMHEYDLSQIDLQKYNTIGLKSDHIKTDENETKKRLELSFNKNDLPIAQILNIESDSDIALRKNELENEKTTDIAAIDRSTFADFGSKNIPFYYISDLHLCHILKRKKADTYNKIIKTIREVVTSIKKSHDKHSEHIFSFRGEEKIIFAGDTSSNPYVYELFLNELKAQGIKNVIFILGNHEYWEFESFGTAIEWYKSITEKYGYQCLHNELLLYMDDDNRNFERVIDGNSILEQENDEIIKMVEKARYIILGGTGFAGCNKEYNAKVGLYGKGMGTDLAEARRVEISESQKFENIYYKLFDILSDRQVIICTHNPVSDWTFEGYCENWIYVSGHTHTNKRKISKKVRLYADNQIAYKRSNIILKYFSVETKNEIFCHYKDGIYEISPYEYQDFMDGRNISMTLDYKDDLIYMLKREGYYLFMTFRHTQKNGLQVCVFDGGRKRRVPRNTKEYYWENMLNVISLIEGKTIKYNTLISRVSEYVKSFGGVGRIHGCIVDIDYFTHLYVNPIDQKITPYYAKTKFERLVYSDVDILLEEKCPLLYDNYKKLAVSENINDIIKIEKKKAKPQYDNTYIYSESEKIKRLDLLRSDKILTDWIELPDENNLLPVNSNQIENRAIYHGSLISENQSKENIKRQKRIEEIKGEDHIGLSLAEINEIKFRQWLKADRFMDKVIETYISIAKENAIRDGINLFEITNYNDLEAYKLDKNRQFTTKERAMLKYYYRFWKEILL